MQCCGPRRDSRCGIGTLPDFDGPSPSDALGASGERCSESTRERHTYTATVLHSPEPAILLRSISPCSCVVRGDIHSAEYVYPQDLSSPMLLEHLERGTVCIQHSVKCGAPVMRDHGVLPHTKWYIYVRMREVSFASTPRAPEKETRAFAASSMRALEKKTEALHMSRLSVSE